MGLLETTVLLNPVVILLRQTATESQTVPRRLQFFTGTSQRKSVIIAGNRERLKISKAGKGKRKLFKFPFRFTSPHSPSSFPTHPERPYTQATKVQTLTYNTQKLSILRTPAVNFFWFLHSNCNQLYCFNSRDKLHRTQSLNSLDTIKTSFIHLVP